jgi:hypothetical protein
MAQVECADVVGTPRITRIKVLKIVSLVAASCIRLLSAGNEKTLNRYSPAALRRR